MRHHRRSRSGSTRTRFSSRRVGALGLLGTVLALAAALLTPSASAAPAAQPAIVAGSTLSAVEGTSDTLDIPVPEGLTPTTLTGTLTSEVADGTVRVLLGGVTAYTSTGAGRSKVSIKVPPNSLDADRRLHVTLRYAVRDPESQQICDTLEPVTASLTGIRLGYRGSETPPTTVGTFFPEATPRVYVETDPDADDDVLQAAIAAVSSLTWRYPSPTKVSLVSTGTTIPNPAPGDRVVRFEHGSGTVRAGVDTSGPVPVLTIAGGSDELLAAARGLRDPAIQLGNSGETAGLYLDKPTPSDSDSELHQTLEDAAGTKDLVVSGYGTSQAYVGVKQDIFGGPVSSIRLHIVGTHTAVPRGASAQLDVLFNDRLIASVALDRLTTSTDGDVDLDLRGTVSAADLNSTNGLVFRLSAVPGEGQCVRAPTNLPLEVHIDTTRSTMDATRGGGKVVGFPRFPQVLGGELPIAIRGTGATRFGHAVEAAAIAGSLQREAAQPLDVELVDADDFVDSDRSGLLVGATDDDAAALHAPLRLGAVRTFDYVNAKFQVKAGSPFAALQAISSDSRDVLMLGGWGGTSTSELTERAVARITAKGWSSLVDDVLVSTGEKTPFTLSSGAFVPQEEVKSESGGFVKWLLLGLLVLLVLLAGNLYLVRRRRRKIAELVDAQQRADAAAATEPVRPASPPAREDDAGTEPTGKDAPGPERE